MTRSFARPPSWFPPAFFCLAILVPPLVGAPVRFALVGDLMLGSDHPSPEYALKDPAALLAPVADELRADVTIGNLEGAVASADHPVVKKGKRSFGFRMPPVTADALAKSGFHVLNLANNHSLDCGPEGVEDALRHLTRVGLRPTGLLTRTARLEANGRRVSVLGFSTYGVHPNFLDIPASVERIRAERTNCDLLVVTFHGGREGADAVRTPSSNETYLGEPRGRMRDFARAAVDAGADLVFGHGPHVIRAVEVYRGKLVAYSLGNFVGHKQFNLNGVFGVSFILQATLGDRGELLSARVVPVRLEVEGPTRVDPDRQAIALLNRLAALDFPETGLSFDEKGAARLAAEAVK